jgi:dolichol-phosphate mannosyltransferase
MDADFSHPPKVLLSLFKLAKQKNIVAIASRYKNSASISNATGSISAKILSWVLNLFIHKLLKIQITDYTSGFIVLPRRVFKNYKLTGDYGEYFIPLVFYASKNIKIEEIEYKSPPRSYGESKTGRNFIDLTKRGLKYIYITLKLTINECTK